MVDNIDILVYNVSIDTLKEKPMKRDRSAYFKEYYEKNKEKKLEKQKISSKLWRDKNKEELKKKSKEYYEKNKDTLLEKQKKAKREKYAKDPKQDLTKQKEWKINNQEKYLLQSARARAKKYGIAFNITVEDIKIPEKCPYLEVVLVPFDKWRCPSLDRIDPNRGYVKGNVQVISNKANTMKNCATQEELQTFAKNIIWRKAFK